MKNIYLILTTMAIAVFIFSGCKKDLYSPATKTPGIKLSNTDSAMVNTPFGPRLRSDVHLIENGYGLKYVGGHLQKIELASGKMVEDYGIPTPLKYLVTNQVKNGPLQTNNRFNMQQPLDIIVSPTDSTFVNWKTWASGNHTKQGYFSKLTVNPTFYTNWTVPSLPSITTDGQIIYIYNALTDTTGATILQPVLQFGNNGYLGSNTSWTIANYFVACGTCVVVHSSGVSVKPGDALDGQMQLTNQPGAEYTATFYLNGQPSTSLSVPNSPHLTTLYETLEATNVTKAGDYPPNNYIAMYPAAGSGNPVNNFVAYDSGAAKLGEHTNISSNDGEVDLYFRIPVAAPVITYSTPHTFDTGIAISTLSPTNTGGAPTGYTISPALPAGLNFNQTTGVISGTPTVSSPPTNYTITATNAGGNGNFTINITVVNTYPFVVSSGSGSSTIYNLVFNGITVVNGDLVASYNINNLRLAYTFNSNSTVVMQVASGYMPVAATLYGSFAPINGTISGKNITFTGVNLNGAQCQIVIN